MNVPTAGSIGRLKNRELWRPPWNWFFIGIVLTATWGVATLSRRYTQAFALLLENRNLGGASSFPGMKVIPIALARCS
jgi:hypothetical protein